MEIEDRVFKVIKDYDLINEGDTLIIGASGGPDSQFMTYVLDKLKDELGFKMVLAHLNHLHRKEAGRDLDLVRQTAKNLKLDFYSRERSMDDYAKKLKISPEDAGRRLRYEFFRDLAINYPKSKIAIAHNKDDQAETVLMRIIRGTGLDGLRAMDYKSADIIRPILGIEKREILSYLDKNSYPYAIDHTNFENDYTRNKLRLDILPEMAKINPTIINQIFRLSVLAKEDLKILDDLVDKNMEEMADVKKDRISFDRLKFERTDSSLLRRILRRSIEIIKGEVKDFSKENIDEFLKIRELETGKMVIKDDIRLRKSYEKYFLELTSSNFKIDLELDLAEDSEVFFNGNYIKTSIISSGKFNNDKNVGYFDYDKLTFPLKIRTRRKGDRFIPLGHKTNKKLKDFLSKEKVDRLRRDQIPLIVSDEKIVWVAPFRISDEFKVTSKTKKILKIEVYDEN